jgi:hypothetical protein
MTCNRDDFLKLAETKPHRGMIVVIRRKTRAQERAVLLRLLVEGGIDARRDLVEVRDGVWNDTSTKRSVRDVLERPHRAPVQPIYGELA